MGSKVAETLLRSGVYRFVLVDGDVMFPANLERHTLDWRDVGFRKANAVKRRLCHIVSGATVDVVAANLNWQRSAQTHTDQIESIAKCDLIKLNQEGLGINRKRVQRLMRVMGIEALVPRPGTSKAAPGHKIYPYLLCGVSITEPNHVWASDITYIPMALGFLYLVAIIDWASRAVLAWRLSNTMDTGFCIAALDEALARHGTPKIFNTDQGAQFTSAAFTGKLEAAGIAISMDGRGRFMDNIFIERLWRSIKYEEVHLKAYADGREARNGIGLWMNFYNHHRPHQAMNNQFPMAAWRAGTDRIEAAKTVDMPLRLDNANALPTYPQQTQKQHRKLLDLKDKGRRDYTLTSAIPGPSSGVHFTPRKKSSPRSQRKYGNRFPKRSSVEWPTVQQPSRL